MTLQHGHPRTRSHSQDPHGNAPHPSTPIRWARQPRGAGACSRLGLASPGHLLPGLSTWKRSTPVTPGCRSAPPCRSGCRAASPLSISSPVSQPALAAGQRPVRVYSTAWLRFPANPPGDTGRSREAHPSSHSQAPARSPEPAVMARGATARDLVEHRQLRDEEAGSPLPAGGTGVWHRGPGDAQPCPPCHRAGSPQRPEVSSCAQRWTFGGRDVKPSQSKGLFTAAAREGGRAMAPSPPRLL